METPLLGTEQGETVQNVRTIPLWATGQVMVTLQEVIMFI